MFEVFPRREAALDSLVGDRLPALLIVLGHLAQRERHFIGTRFGVWGLGFRIEGLGVGVWVWVRVRLRGFAGFGFLFRVPTWFPPTLTIRPNRPIADDRFILTASPFGGSIKAAPLGGLSRWI